MQLVSSLYKDQAAKFDPPVSIKTVLTEIRVRELLQDPTVDISGN